MNSGNRDRADDSAPIRHSWWGGRRAQAAQAEAPEPEAPAPAAPEPTANEPTANRPAAPEPAANRPAANRPAAPEPAENRPTANGPTANGSSGDAPGTLPSPHPYRLQHPGGSTEEQLQRLVDDMREAIPELTGVMIASDDGLSLCHDFPDSDSERVAAMAATAAGLGKRISERADLGVMQETVVRGDDGYLVVYTAGRSAVLVLAGPKNSNLGLMRIEARGASAHIGHVLP